MRLYFYLLEMKQTLEWVSAEIITKKQISFRPILILNKYFSFFKFVVLSFFADIVSSEQLPGNR